MYIIRNLTTLSNYDYALIKTIKKTHGNIQFHPFNIQAAISRPVLLSASHMKKQSNNTGFNVSQKQRKQDLLHTDEWGLLTFGMKDAEIAGWLRVSVSTARRWRLAESRIPWWAVELMRQRAGVVLPGAFRGFAGFRVVPGHDGLGVLVPPGMHFRAGMRPLDVMQWHYLRGLLAARHGQPAIDQHGGQIGTNG